MPGPTATLLVPRQIRGQTVTSNLTEPGIREGVRIRHLNSTGPAAGNKNTYVAVALADRLYLKEFPRIKHQAKTILHTVPLP